MPPAIKVHVIYRPEVPAYRIDLGRLLARVAPLAREAGVRVAATESPAGARTAELESATVLVGSRIPRAEVASFPELRWIHLTSAGVEHLLPLDWLPRRVVLTNSSGIHADLAAEYAACSLLMLNFAMPRYVRAQREHRWQQILDTTPLRGKTLVVIGVGAIGGAVARQAKRLGMRVIGVRATARSHRSVDEMRRPDELRAVMRRAEFVVVTAPLTPRSRGMVDREALAALPAGAGVVCISRAGLVDYAALAEMLAAGRLRGAVVDVCDPEPLPSDDPLWEVPNLLITPHISSDVVDYGDRVIDVFAENFRRFVGRRALRNRVDPRRGY